MADDDIGAAKVAQHRAGGLAGARALLFPVQILRAERQVGGGTQNAMHRFQRRERWGQHDLYGRLLGQGAGQFLHEADGLGGRLVHLPIPDHKRGAHGLLIRSSLRSGSATRQGSVLPSNNPSAAPPPVEMKEIFSDSPARWIAM